MNQKIKVDLTILPNPVRIWDLSIGSLFSLTESGKNLAGQYQIYCKISQTKCLLFSHPDKIKFLIPKLVPSDIGYAIIESWDLIETEDSIQEDG